jgi:hypothetical protein
VPKSPRERSGTGDRSRSSSREAHRPQLIPISIVSPDGSTETAKFTEIDTDENDDDSDENESRASDENREVDEMLQYLERHGRDRSSESSGDYSDTESHQDDEGEGEEDDEEAENENASIESLGLPLVDATTTDTPSFSKMYTNNKDYVVHPFRMNELETKLTQLVDQTTESMSTQSTEGSSNPLDHLENYLRYFRGESE